MRSEDEGFPKGQDESSVGGVFDQLVEQPVEGGHQRAWAFEGLKEASESTQEVAAELATWWMETSEADLNAVVPKAVQYGGADLEVMGEAMQHLIPKEARKKLGELRCQKMGLEMAVAFYALGKVARLYGAFEQGRMPSEDTWFDLEIYARMGRRVRETGSWITL